MTHPTKNGKGRTEYALFPFTQNQNLKYFFLVVQIYV